MPGKVKVKVLAGRNLPVMDRSSDTTDAYVEIKLGGITHKTDVCRKSLNPQWNSDWYRFEMDDAELQDEPLQIRLMDYDTYSANDAIGKVHPICLNPMLIPGAVIDPSGHSGHGHGKGSVMSGWLPVYDTMHGIRGEVNLIIKVDLFSDVNKFRQSSCGVQFFHSPNIPHGYHAPAIHGFVEELVVNDDPEYQWIDKIRTPRASNEARQVVFLKLSGEVQRKIGLKALDMGANAVIGYKLCLDLEGDVGVVARGIGTAVTLIKIPDAPQQVADSALIEERTLKYLEFLTCTPSPSHLRDSFTFESPAVGRFSLFPAMRNECEDFAARRSLEVDEMMLQRMTQEDLRGKSPGRFVKKLKNLPGGIPASRNAIGRRILARAPDFGLTAAPKLNQSTQQSPGKTKNNRRKQFQRSSSEGAGMTSLLVASLMSSQTMGLDRISESHDSRPSSQNSKILSTSVDMSQSIDTLCMSQSSKTSLFPSFESDSLSSDDEASDSTPERVEVCFDADTVSMVMRNVQKDDSDTWIASKMPDEMVKMGTSRIVTGGAENQTVLIESESTSREETLQEILKTCPENLDTRDDVSWIKPGSTSEEPEITTLEVPHKSFVLRTFQKIRLFRRRDRLPPRSDPAGSSLAVGLKSILKKKFSRKSPKRTLVVKPIIKIKETTPTDPEPKKLDGGRGGPFMSLIELVEKDYLQAGSKNAIPDRHNSLPVTLTSLSVESPMASNPHTNLSHTNKMLLAPSPLSPNARNEAASTAAGANAASPGSKVPTGHTRAESTGSRITQSPAKSGATVVPVACKDSGIYRRSSDSDLSVTPKGNSLTSCERGTPAVTRVVGATMKTANTDNLDMLEYPFLTLDKYPPGFIIHLGSAVCSRSVKLLERVPNPDEPECRDSWYTELRMEIRSHARALGCNVVLGYSEMTTIAEDVCVLSATGTAALINFPYSSEQPVRMTSSLDRVEFEKDVKEGIKELKIAASTAKIIEGVATKPIEEVPESGSDKETPSLSCPPPTSATQACALLHLPYAANSVPFSVTLDSCAVCRRAKVPNVFLATIEIPDGLQITGRGCLVQAQVCRQKRDLKGESNAKEISDGLPFLEYELYRVLINKMKVKGMNAIFGLKCSIAVGEKMMTVVATGTAVYLSALPAAALPKIVGAERVGSNPEKLTEIQRTLQDTIEKNREIYQLKTFGDVDPRPLSESEESDDELADMDLNVGNKDACILEVDDIEDLEVISLLMEPCPPEGFHVVNTQSVPGLLDLEVVRNLQYFAQVWRGHINQQSHLAKNLQRLLQCIYYKLRSMIPCAICDLRFTIDLPEADWIQVLVTGMALGLGEPSKIIKNKRRLLSNSASKEGIKKGEDELIFNLEEDHVFETVAPTGVSQSLTHTPTTQNPPGPFAQTGSLKLRNKSPTRGKAPTRLSRHMPVRERYGVDVTPLSYVPGGRIEKYLGNLNFFFIRESTSIRENGGICGFVHGFITELLAVVRAHVTALGGNAMVSFYMTELLLNESIHKNQGQSLISVGGDVVFVSYYADE